MARRFSFRLQPILRLKEALEKEAQRALGRRIQARMALEATLVELEDRHHAARELRRAEPGEALDLERWRAVERFLVATERAMAATRDQLREAEVLVEQARQDLTRAHQEHLTLLRLKERLQEEHTRELLREEVQVADDTAVLRHRFSVHPAIPAQGGPP